MELLQYRTKPVAKGIQRRRAFGAPFNASTHVARRWNRINRPAAVFVVSTMLGTLALPAAAQSPSFRGLGQMPGVWPGAGTYASAISGDGSTIMGYGWVCPNGGT